MLTNIVVGASSVAYRDFVVGTILGMGAFVIALAGFGYQLTRALRSPSPRTWIGAALFVGVPLTLAWLINRSCGERGRLDEWRGRTRGTQPATRHRPRRDRPAREELLARRARGSLLLHSGRRRPFPAGERGLARARHTVFILGWDIFAAVDLLPGSDSV